MVVFGGGNEGIVDELHVYNTGKDKNIRDVRQIDWIFIFYKILKQFWSIILNIFEVIKIEIQI